ncbi:MAG: sensor histidine kinase [Bacteroidia bacterium]
MKLLYKNILINALASLLIIFIGGVISYYFIVNKIQQESHEHLIGEKQIVEKKLKQGEPLSVFENNIGDQIIVKEISALSGRKPYFKTFEQKEEFEETNESHEADDNGIFETQAIVFECPTKDKDYQVTIIKTYDNDEELGGNIMDAVTISALLMIIAIVLINIIIYKRIWAPFYFTLKELKNFNISKRDTIKFKDTNTTEFNQLNSAITLMAEKISFDYLSLKEFTENASHEIQTPLAIINSKIEMCLQDKQLSPEQANLLIEASYAVSNLVNINKGLLMLTKLDNNQVDLPSDVNISDIIYERLNLFEEFIEGKDIDVNLRIDKNATIRINISLAGILFDNLIKNAIKHNLVSGGKINIEVTNQFIKIANTGAEPKVSTDKFFERFYKDGSQESLGLGLAIVKKITEIYGFKISYQYAEGLHVVTLNIQK